MKPENSAGWSGAPLRAGPLVLGRLPHNAPSSIARAVFLVHHGMFWKQDSRDKSQGEGRTGMELTGEPGRG